MARTRSRRSIRRGRRRSYQRGMSTGAFLTIVLVALVVYAATGRGDGTGAVTDRVRSCSETGRCSWQLVIGADRRVRVTEAVYRRCPQRSVYPACSTIPPEKRSRS